MKKVGIIIFIVAIVLGVALANAFSFGKTSTSFLKFNIDFGRVKGSGNIVTDRREVAKFSSIEVSGAFIVEAVAQKESSVEVEGDDNLLQYIRTEVRDGRLEVSSEKSFSTGGRIKIRISAPNIENVDLSGASTLTLADVKNESLRLESSGASKIRISGETGKFDVEMRGASKLDASDLKATDVSVDSSGASTANVFVSGELRADLSGASRVNYSGSPKNVVKEVSGASSVSGN